MTSIAISLIPTGAMLLIGALLWVFVPKTQARPIGTCHGCGARHHNLNECDGTLSAFCTDECYHSFMLENYYPNG